jgi:hypothetical protein
MVTEQEETASKGGPSNEIEAESLENQEKEIPSKENPNSSNTRGVWSTGSSAYSLGLSVYIRLQNFANGNIMYARWEISINSESATATWKQTWEDIFRKSVWQVSHRVTEEIIPSANESVPNKNPKTPKV